jgi:hypothetical protein
VRRIENYGIEVTDTTLGKEGSDIAIDRLDKTIIFLRGSTDGFDTGLGGVDCHDMLGACASCLKGEATAVRVAIEHLTAFAKTANECVLFTLIKKKAWLPCFQEVDAVGKSVYLDPTGFEILATLGSSRTIFVDYDLLGLAGFS